MDTVRLQVLLHEARHGNADQIFYADFDVWNAKLSHTHVHDCIEKRGYVLAIAKGGYGDNIFENGYFGFDRFYAEKILTGKKGLLTQTAKDALANRNGFDALNKFISKHGYNPFDSGAQREIGILVQQKTGYMLPRNRFYESLGLESEPIPSKF